MANILIDFLDALDAAELYSEAIICMLIAQGMGLMTQDEVHVRLPFDVSANG